MLAVIIMLCLCDKLKDLTAGFYSLVLLAVLGLVPKSTVMQNTARYLTIETNLTRKTSLPPLRYSKIVKRTPLSLPATSDRLHKSRTKVETRPTNNPKSVWNHSHSPFCTSFCHQIYRLLSEIHLCIFFL